MKTATGYKTRAESATDVLLSNGELKSISDIVNIANFTLGATNIKNGSTTTTITGPFTVSTDMSENKAFSVLRSSATEIVKHWIDDSNYYIKYINDELTSNIKLIIQNTGTEGGNEANATIKTLTISSSLGIYPETSNTGSLGTSSYKWDSLYANTLNGNLAKTFTVLGVGFNNSADVTVNPSDLAKQASSATANITDKTELFTSDANGSFSNYSNTVYKRPASSIWNYILTNILKGNSTTTPYTGTLYFKDTNVLHLCSNDKDLNIWTVSGAGNSSWEEKYGFTLTYKGTGSDNNNTLNLYAHNQTGSRIEAAKVTQSGVITFNSTPIVNGTYLSLATHTHPTSIATTTDTSNITLSPDTKYKLTTGGTSTVFTTAPNTWRKVSVNDTSIGSNALTLKGSTNISLNNSNGTVTVSATGLALSGHTHSYLPLSGGLLTGSLNFSTANAVIEWNTETYRQRIKTNDDSTSGTAVFTFQQSSNSGSSWTDLFTVKDDGTVVATTFSGNATSATVVKDANGTMKLYAENNNEINFGGTNSSGVIYFGYQDKDSKKIPTDFYFGGTTGTAKVHATNFYVPNKTTDCVLTSGGTKVWTTGATASALVARDANGYIYAKYVSTDISVEDTKEPSHFYYTYNSDKWIRKMTYNRLKTLLNNSLTVCEANLKWGGRDISGGVSPVDAAAMSYFNANRALFCKPAGVTIEYTTDGGTTWTDYPNATDAMKINLMSDIGSAFYIGGSSNATVTTSCKLRITLNATNMGLYTWLKKILVNISTNGASSCSVIIESSNKGSETTWATLRTSSISGYSNWNSLTFDKGFGGGDTQTSNVANYRLTFQIGAIGTSSTSNLYVMNILLFGLTNWKTCSKMARTGHLYSYDYNQIAYFPKWIYLNNDTSWGAVAALKNNGYWSLRTPEGNDTYLCVPGNGLLPSSANSTTGQSSLGTSTWYFKSAYIKNVYGTADVAKAAYIATGTTAHPAGDYKLVIESGTHTSSPNANTIYFVT